LHPEFKQNITGALYIHKIKTRTKSAGYTTYTCLYVCNPREGKIIKGWGR